MIVLGINEAHNASAALAINGEIVAAAQEERFSRIKNHIGIPLEATRFCLNFAKITGEKVDLIVFTGGIPNFITNIRSSGQALSSAHYLLKLGQAAHIKYRNFVLNLEYHFPYLRGIDKSTVEPIIKLTQRIFFPKTAQILEEKFGLLASRHTYLDHHTAHAYSALYTSGFTQKFDEILIATCDGGGDGLSATVSVFKSGKLKRIATSTQDNSLGVLYGCITDILGMQPLEHEYKVMGLAPYAKGLEIERIYNFLKSTISFDKKTLSFRTIVASDNMNRYLREHLPKYRFDHLAAALQKLTEELLVDWISAAVSRTGVGNVVFGGGVAQNIKANQKIAALPQIKNFFVMPSAGDESNAIGAVYWGTKQIDKQIRLKPIKNLYLGPEYKSDQIENVLRRKNHKHKVKKMKDPPKKIARLLTDGQIVARFAGRMEFGARALGNRSILADPTLPQVTDLVNRQIKSRDFWMPFAPTILAEDMPKYLINQKNLQSQFMTIGFDTNPETRKDLLGAIHPFDYTCRPQILTKEDNPDYWKIIKNFKNTAGRGAILNTSFNLHGEPIVCSPEDAITTFAKSGLKYLALEDYLIQK